MRNGLYLPDGSFMRFADASSGSLSQEIAVRSRSIDYYGIGNIYLPNPDPVLKAQGKDIQVYTDLLVDDRVGGGAINRVAAVKSLVWKIERGQASARQHKALQTLFAGYDMDAIFEAIVKGARGYGYSPIELIWGLRDGLSLPLSLTGKPQRWFVYDQDNRLRFCSREKLLEGEELPPRTFICPTNEASYDNPYGVGLLSRCFWPVVFKKGGWRFWIKFSEKFGQVWPVGKLPRSATPEQRSDLLEVLSQMISDGVAVIPDDGSVDFLESGSKGATSDMYNGIIAQANSAISTIWHGHAGAGESTSGKLGQDETALVVRDDLRDDDANLICRTLQQVINWIFEVNWGSSESACTFVLTPREQIDTTQSERDVNLSNTLERSGLKLSRDYFMRTYGLEDGDIEDQPTPPTPVPRVGPQSPVKATQYSEPVQTESQAAIDSFLASFSNDDLQREMNGVLMPVVRGIKEIGDFDGAMEKLSESYPAMDTTQMQELLTQMIFTAELAGRIDKSTN
jgi:phage gp29-like protein